MSVLFKETFYDFPFDCDILKRFESFLPQICSDEFYGVMIVGTCKGSIIDREDKKIFFKAAYDNTSYKLFDNEVMIFKTLEENSFIPKFYGYKEYGRYKIMFMEYIKGNTLEILTPKSDLWNIKIREVLEKLYFLYKKHKFIHNDISMDNILIDDNYNIYIIDFEVSRINGYWSDEFNAMIFRLINDGDVDTNFTEFEQYLEYNKTNNDPEKYLKAINVFMKYFDQ